LGDYLAVVPVKELVMENCGLTDEGVRVILAGLLSAKFPEWERRKVKKGKWGGVVSRWLRGEGCLQKQWQDWERWLALHLHIHRYVSVTQIDGFIKSSIPPAPGRDTVPRPSHLTRTISASSTTHPEVSCVLSKAIGERLAGREFELLNIAECGMTTEQLGDLIDWSHQVWFTAVSELRKQNYHEGMQHVARYIRDGKCEGLDLAGNDLRDQLGVDCRCLNRGQCFFYA